MKSESHPNFVFFGTDDFAVSVLEELKNQGWLPSLIVTNPDRPRGRYLKLEAPPVKIWAEDNNLPFLQPEKIDEVFGSELKNKVSDAQFFLVASFGKILPTNIINTPPGKTLNIHPSLLPELRGPSPIEDTILQGKKPAVTIIILDEEMDHGPILAEEEINSFSLAAGKKELEKTLATLGARLIVKKVPDYLSGKLLPREQEHSKATYTKKITKEDGLIDLSDSPDKNYRKFLAYLPWPGIFFFLERGGKKIRVKITDASFENGSFVIKKVIPEGKKEMDYKSFSRD
ncbi:MAG: methionyl-tRNA formyltransferase [Candidatus Vogelbacteria bacterium CG10_big_fil_rev_8_21_14_0_10_45_14]|uniref:methionyl-tRNA formyltransferase n=1 Tax=Candidatus Vogelbacteria bacterium CG10_big_fil_rev_8_21_14_0_10_45_14 TaxID=1975042 RepID=A0A2H0RKZ1_9BACT|nr:MAG: methionyl-tRNA formyltransferase [Candidatus Vogelbacteria bacterium CG10_big_fil_rev_8_21_14_0_10_45_14]